MLQSIQIAVVEQATGVEGGASATEAFVCLARIQDSGF